MRWLVASVASALVFSPSASASGPLPNPCLLLTTAQVAPAVGGHVQAHALSGNRLYRTCVWTGAPQGYSQSRAQFIVSLSRVSISRFVAGEQGSKPPSQAVSGLGTVAFSSNVGLAVWKKGIALELDGSYFSVYPAAGRHLAQVALSNLS
jgi:hypothetical protein